MQNVLNVAQTKFCLSGPGEEPYSTEEFLRLQMDGKVILRAEFPRFADDYVFAGYKIMPRAVVRNWTYIVVSLSRDVYSREVWPEILLRQIFVSCS